MRDNEITQAMKRTARRIPPGSVHDNPVMAAMRSIDAKEREEAETQPTVNMTLTPIERAALEGVQAARQLAEVAHQQACAEIDRRNDLIWEEIATARGLTLADFRDGGYQVETREAQWRIAAVPAPTDAAAD